MPTGYYIAEACNKQKDTIATAIELKGCLGSTHCSLEVHDHRCPIKVGQEIRLSFVSNEEDY